MSLWENNLVVPSYSTTRTGDAVLWAEQTALSQKHPILE